MAASLEGVGPNELHRRGSDRLDLSLFAFIAFAGAAFIAATKQAGFSLWLSTGLPCLLILAYAALTGFAGPLRLRSDRAGDNCYYLGFLYTLTSLAVAFWQVGQGLEDADAGAGIEGIISNFGVALATTIMGIAMRVLLSQMREDPVEYELETRRDLATAAGRVKGELDAMLVDMTSFRRALTQSMQEAGETMRRAAVGSAHDLAEGTRAVVAPLERLSQALDAGSAGLARMEQSAAAAVGPLQGIERSLAGTLSTFSRAASAAKDMGETVRTAGSASERLRDATGQLSAVLEQVSRQQSEILGRLGSEARRDLDLIRQHREEMARELERARQTTAEVQRSLAGLADLIVERLGP